LTFKQIFRTKPRTKPRRKRENATEFDGEIALALAGAPFPRHSHLQLVSAPPPLRLGRHEVRIVVSAARLPIGRTRVFRLAESDIDELTAIATRMERRA
jgi:hypothetical protein